MMKLRLTTPGQTYSISEQGCESADENKTIMLRAQFHCFRLDLLATDTPASINAIFVFQDPVYTGAIFERFHVSFSTM